MTLGTSQRRTPMEYYWMSKYDVVSEGVEYSLIFKKKTTGDPTTLIIPRDEYFEVLNETHKSCSHGGRDKITQALKNKFYIPKKAVEIFVALCPACEIKKVHPKKSINQKRSRPAVSQDSNKGQADLIDFQSCPDGDYKWLLIYHDTTSTFVNLRPLRTKTANEVAVELFKIFMIFGAPCILQSANGLKFTVKLIKELAVLWPAKKIVHGSTSSPQTQGGEERSIQDVENMLRLWMSANTSTNWSLGCHYVQYHLNTSFNRKLEKTPYKALFGNDHKTDMNSSPIDPLLFVNVKEEKSTQLPEQDFSDIPPCLKKSRKRPETDVDTDSD